MLTDNVVLTPKEEEMFLLIKQALNKAQILEKGYTESTYVSLTYKLKQKFLVDKIKELRTIDQPYTVQAINRINYTDG